MRKYLSKGTLLLMVLMLAVSPLFGCGQESTQQVEESTVSDQTQVVSTQASDNGVPKEKVTLNVLYPGDQSKRMTEFLDNEFKVKMLEELNTEFKVQYSSWANYWQKLDLMLASGEPLDWYWDVYLSKHVSKKECIPLDELINQYGQDIKKVTPEQNFYTVDGKIYSIPCQAAATGDAMNTILARTDLLDAVGVTKIETAQDLLDASAKIKEKFPLITPFSGIFSRMLVRDTSISNNRDIRSTITDFVYVVENEEENKIYSTFDDKDLIKGINSVTKQLVDKNYLAEQTLTEPDNDITRYQNGNYVFVNGAISRPMELIGAVSKNAPDAKLREYILNPSSPKYTTGPGSNALFISPNCKNPERVVMFWNWIWKSQDNYNFALYGVKDKDYKIDDNNRLILLSTDSLWYEWMFRNINYMMFPTNVTDDFINDYKNWDSNTKMSKTYGFTFDQEPVKAEAARIETVWKTKVGPLLNGYVDFDKNYDAILAQMKSAGIDKFVAEMQKQFDAYKASQK